MAENGTDMRKSRIYAVTAAVVTALGLIAGWITIERLERQLHSNYERALMGFAQCVAQVDIELQKCLCAGTRDRFSQEAAVLWSNSQQAKLFLAELAWDDCRLERIDEFLSQAGEYAMSISGTDITGARRDRLIELSKRAGVLRVAVEELISRYNDRSRTKDIQYHEMMDISVISRRLEEVEGVDGNSRRASNGGSENIRRSDPALLKGLKEISREEAAEVAMGFLGEDDVEYIGVQEGDICGHIFSCGKREISVSSVGGVVIQMFDSRRIRDSNISSDEAILCAKRFLDEHGIKSMVISDVSVYGNKCTVDFIYSHRENILVYPDRIKVAVALDSGEIIGYDAGEYIMNHREDRRLTAGKTRSQAQTVLSGVLNVCDCSMAVIDSDSSGEVLCYEFLCDTWSGEQAMIYVNSSTLAEERILLCGIDRGN